MKGRKMLLNDLVIGNEYYFYFNGYYLVGFVTRVKGNLISIEKGHCYGLMDSYEPLHAYIKGKINANNIIGYALA